MLEFFWIAMCYVKWRRNGIQVAPPPKIEIFVIQTRLFLQSKENLFKNNVKS